MLKLEYKKIPEDVLEYMEESIRSDVDYYDKAICKIKEILPSDEIHILNSANSCIFTVVEALDDPIVVVNQGGWNGFNRSADILNKEIREIQTDDGIINIEILSKYIEENDISSIYITSLAGYTAPQPIQEIYKLCHLHDITVVVDISGSLGNKELSNTNYADIQVSSTGSPKIINIENGGFINNITQKVKLNKHLLKTFKADKITCAGIYKNIENAEKILQKTIKANMYLKNKLSEELKDDKIHNIIHENKEGINIIITEESKKKAKNLSFKIRQQIEIDKNKSIITTGPNYNRLKKPCVCIEIKNINENYLTKENIDKLNDIIINSINN